MVSRSCGVKQEFDAPPQLRAASESDVRFAVGSIGLPKIVKAS